MAEANQKFEHQIVSRVVNDQAAVLRRGQRYALVSVLAALALGGLLGYRGHPFAAGVIGGLPVVGLAAVFITGRRAAPAAGSSIPPAAKNALGAADPVSESKESDG